MSALIAVCAILAALGIWAGVLVLCVIAATLAGSPPRGLDRYMRAR